VTVCQDFSTSSTTGTEQFCGQSNTKSPRYGSPRSDSVSELATASFGGGCVLVVEGVEVTTSVEDVAIPDEVSSLASGATSLRRDATVVSARGCHQQRRRDRSLINRRAIMVAWRAE